MYDSDSSSQFCFRQIVRQIVADGIEPGGRLPTQEQLRRRFGVSNKTLGAAMERLVAAGILARKTRTGTVLADRAPLLALRWHIGILTFDAPGYGPGAFYACLHHALTVRLSACGWAAATYVRRAPRWPAQRIADFPGLEIDLEGDRADGVITITALDPAAWARLDREGIAGCHVGTWDGDTRGVFIDLLRFHEEAAAALAALGCRRIGRTDLALAHGGASGAVDALTPVLPFQPGIEGGRHTAAALMDLPQDQVPDGLIIPDDYAAAELIRVFAAAGRRLPRLAVLANRQVPIHFDAPVLTFEVDIDALAEHTVAALRNRVLGTAAPTHAERVAPVRREKALGIGS